MKLCVLLAICAAVLTGGSSGGELEVTAKAPEYATGNMWFLETVTFSLEGYAPLVIKANLETGVYPAGASEIHKIGEARFVTVGNYSTGGGMWTIVVRIIHGRDGRLEIQDQLEYTRDRRKYSEKFVTYEGGCSYAIPPVPKSRLEAHALFDWQIQVGTKKYDVKKIRSFELTKHPALDVEMIVFSVGEKGFEVPRMKKEEQDGAEQAPTAPESK